MATQKRLSDEDVRAIFECLHHGTPVPPHLKFQIVEVGPKGMKLSPPSIEFADGLYVLLQPAKRKTAKRPAFTPKVPPHLAHLVAKDLPTTVCPWQLSGPQFPNPSAIQQRYCYPHGREEYSSKKGAALWTFFNHKREEDIQFRLLHVYFSIKRATNKGCKLGTHESAIAMAQTPKRPKRSATPGSSARRKAKKMKTHVHHDHPSPAITASTAASMRAASLSSVRSVCSSPLSFDASLHQTPPSPSQSHSTAGSNFVTPIGDLFRPRLMAHSHLHHSNQLTPSPYRRVRGRLPLNRGYGDTEGIVAIGEMSTYPGIDDDVDHAMMHMGGSFQDIDNFMNDPLLSLSIQPSATHDSIEDIGARTKAYNQQEGLSMRRNLCSLKKCLEDVHDSIRDRVRRSPHKQQAAMVNLYGSWARRIARDPFADLMMLQWGGRTGTTSSLSVSSGAGVAAAATAVTAATSTNVAGKGGAVIADVSGSASGVSASTCTAPAPASPTTGAGASTTHTTPTKVKTAPASSIGGLDTASGDNKGSIAPVTPTTAGSGTANNRMAGRAKSGTHHTSEMVDMGDTTSAATAAALPTTPTSAPSAYNDTTTTDSIAPTPMAAPSSMAMTAV